jgi:hypothetical protein
MTSFRQIETNRRNALGSTTSTMECSNGSDAAAALLLGAMVLCGAYTNSSSV